MLGLLFGTGLLALLAALVWLTVVLVNEGVDKASSWASVLGTGIALAGAVATLARLRVAAGRVGSLEDRRGSWRPWAVLGLLLVMMMMVGVGITIYKSTPASPVTNQTSPPPPQMFTCRQTTAKPDVLSTVKSAVLYEITSDKNLYWHKHLDSAHGNTLLNHDQSKLVTPVAWGDYVMITAAQNGVIYVVDQSGDLYWYKHLDPEGGSNQWANNGVGKRVGHGWLESKFLVAASDGVLYRVLPEGDMLWYRHEDTLTGERRWANNGVGKKVGNEQVGNGWSKSEFLVAASDGVFYRVLPEGDMLWYRHEDTLTGERRWANNGVGKKVGNGWSESKFLAGCGDGVFYRVLPEGDMLWYRHEDTLTGERRWANNGVRKRVGVGW